MSPTPTTKKPGHIAKPAVKRPAARTAHPTAVRPAVARAKPAVKAEAKPEVPATVAPKHTGEYVLAVGRRKEAVARVRLFPKGTGLVTVNNVEMAKYFPTFDLQMIITQPAKAVGLDSKVDVRVKVTGGGKVGQAEAVRHGIARALLAFDEELRKTLRAGGFLTRDSRVKERKKYGLKKARRAPQFSKR